MKNLVIVESPSKSKTIEKYLGQDYKVLSSKGHIRDLATTGKFGLGVALEDKFKQNYIAILNNIILAFASNFSCFLCGAITSAGH